MAKKINAVHVENKSKSEWFEARGATWFFFSVHWLWYCTPFNKLINVLLVQATAMS